MKNVKNVKHMLGLLTGVVLVAGLAACGEKGEVVNYKQGKYQGKADTRPYENAPSTFAGSKWTAGDKTSWEVAIKQRQQAQNEYNRAE